MKRLLLKIVLLLIIQNSFGQYHKFYDAHGFILSHGASITHIARAGGGVVLKGIAKPKYPDSLSVFTNVTFEEAKGASTMYIQTQEPKISYTDSSWLMRDAAMLVKSEKVKEMYRDVNLLGKGYDKRYPSYKFFNVEMADSLLNTKSGETLLLMDLLLAGNKNTKYYSDNNEAYEKYKSSKDSLLKVINDYNDSVEDLRYKTINDTYLKLKNFDSLKLAGKLDTSEIAFLNKIKQYSFYYLFKYKVGYQFSYYDDTVHNYLTEINSLFNLDYSDPIDLKYSWSDYTYNDEYSNYTFYYVKNDNHLNIEGEPNFTFLYPGYLSYEDDEYEVDFLSTDYYIQNPGLIKNLNKNVVTNAEHFGRIASFYRYLKSEYPKLWNQVYAHYSHVKKTIGETPRFIGRNPSDKY